MDDEIERAPPELLREPLDWVFAEHYRHRQFCRLIDELAAGRVFDHKRTAKALEFVTCDMPLHLVDEEEDLFPLLRRRSEPADEIDRVLDLLAREHREDSVQAAEVKAILEAALNSEQAPGLDAAAVRVMQDFAIQQRRHLGLENAVVLPLARLRLEREDLAALSARIAARRGYVLDGC